MLIEFDDLDEVLAEVVKKMDAPRVRMLSRWRDLENGDLGENRLILYAVSGEFYEVHVLVRGSELLWVPPLDDGDLPRNMPFRVPRYDSDVGQDLVTMRDAMLSGRCPYVALYERERERELHPNAGWDGERPTPMVQCHLGSWATKECGGCTVPECCGDAAGQADGGA